MVAHMTDGELQGIVTHACTGQMDDEETAKLARMLAESGDVLSWNHYTADLASTGAPSSLSTLLSPLVLHSMGCFVPKLAVPGRPAGGVDVMAQIPGYRTNLISSEVRRVLEACGYVHFEAGERLAPLDARLFRLRQAMGAQAVAPLVIASLLAKKLAVGVQNVGLDVRVAPHGNFGRSFEEARQNAARFCRVARDLKLNAVCILTDATRPYQPLIGRHEALIGLVRVLDGRARGPLERHAADCALMAEATLGRTGGWSWAEARAIFDRNVVAQGGACDFGEMEERLISEHKTYITAPASGYVYFDLEKIRNIIVDRQRLGIDGLNYSDPVGIILIPESGRFVSRGDAIMSVRAPEGWRPELKTALIDAVSFFPERAAEAMPMEVIRG